MSQTSSPSSFVLHVRPGVSITTLPGKVRAQVSGQVGGTGETTRKQTSVWSLSLFQNSLGLSAVRAYCWEMLERSFLHGLCPHLVQQRLQDAGPVLHLAAEIRLQVAVVHLHTVLGERIAPRRASAFVKFRLAQLPAKAPIREVGLQCISELLFE